VFDDVAFAQVGEAALDALDDLQLALDETGDGFRGEKRFRPLGALRQPSESLFHIGRQADGNGFGRGHGMVLCWIVYRIAHPPYRSRRIDLVLLPIA
jgi:hypothetical protein